MTGYEKSPDYGGPDPTWRGALSIAVFMIALAALVWWLLD